MTTETIEAVWKGGKIVPLEEVDLEDDARIIVTITLPKPVATKLAALAGAWKDYKTPEGKTLTDVEKEIYDSRKISARKEVVM